MGLNGLRIRRIGEQAVEFRLDRLVTLAGPFLQPGPVQYGNVPAAVADKPGALQFPGGFRDALATYSQRTGDQFLRQGQFIRGRAVQA